MWSVIIGVSYSMIKLISLTQTKCIGAFKYLINLRTLSIPTVARDKALDLCANLEAIDIIHLSLETHEISCFLLTSGSTYEESMIQTNLYKVPTDAPLTTTTITTVGNLLKPAQSLMEDKIVLKNTKTGTTYDRMCMVYMVISGKPFWIIKIDSKKVLFRICQWMLHDFFSHRFLVFFCRTRCAIDSRNFDRFLHHRIQPIRAWDYV